MFLIDWMPQSAMTLYIYRVGWTYPARNPVYRSKSMKTPSCTRTLPGPVRPVGPCKSGHSASTSQTARSDRLVLILAVNIYPPVFFGKSFLQKKSAGPKLSKGDG